MTEMIDYFPPRSSSRPGFILYLTSLMPIRLKPS